MKLDFIRFKATDDVELQGWLNNEDSTIAALHIHGMSGNGYENYFLDNLREMYAKQNISFFTIDTRGRGIISDFRQDSGWKHAGSCFEIFEESVHDIHGAIDYLKSIGKTKFVLQGHSLGCTKVVNYVISQDITSITNVILLAPTDMTGWAKSHSEHNSYLTKAERLLADGKGEKLVDAGCWMDKTPISAQTYPTICKAGGSADIYGDREGEALLGKVQLPMLIAYGDKDIGIIKIDGSIDKWLDRVSTFKNPNTQISIINGPEHGFRGYEKELAVHIESFLKKSV